jgi:integrase
MALARPRWQEGELTARATSWSLRYREPYLDGDGALRWHQRRHRLGRRREMSRNDAKAAAAAFLEPINRGAERPQSSARFGEYLDRTWRPLIKPRLKYSTGLGYEKIIAKHLLPRFGRDELATIDTLAITEFAALLSAGARGQQTVRNILNCLAGILQSAVNLKLLRENAAHGVSIPEQVCDATDEDEPAGDESLPTPEEFESYLAVLPAAVQTMVLLITLLGLRIGELIGLKWRDVDLARAELVIRRNIYEGKVQLPKGQRSSRGRPGRPKSIPLGPLAIYLLERHRRGSPDSGPGSPMFPSMTGGHHRDGHNLLQRVLHPAARHWAVAWASAHDGQPARPVRWRWHLMKHIYGTEAQRAAQAPADFQRLTRHETPAVTLEHYAHTIPEHLRAAQRVIESRIAPSWSLLAQNPKGKPS